MTEPAPIELDGATAVVGPDSTAAAEPDEPATVNPRKLPPYLRPKRRWKRDWRWAAVGIGKALLAIGVLFLLFFCYQRWGTAIQYSQSQDELENEFDALLATAATTPSTTAPPTASTLPPSTSAEEPEPATSTPPSNPVTTTGATTTTVDPTIALLTLGGALGQIEIPKIDMSGVIVAGVRVEDLRKGVGHFPDTPLPGQQGNSAIAGHRTTYGAPFGRIDQLEPGDEIRITTLQGEFVYRVTEQFIVDPSDYEVVRNQPDKTMLTLVSCHPPLSAKQRIIVTAELEVTESDPVQEAVINYGQDVVLPTGMDQGTDDGTASPADEQLPGELTDETTGAVSDDAEELAALDTADAFSSGWFSDPNAYGQAALWGLACIAVLALCWFVGWRTRYWLGALAGLVPFTVTLYFFFENVNRMLPPSL